MKQGKFTIQDCKVRYLSVDKGCQRHSFSVGLSEMSTQRMYHLQINTHTCTLQTHTHRTHSMYIYCTVHPFIWVHGQCYGCLLSYYWRAGASQPSRPTGTIFVFPHFTARCYHKSLQFHVYTPCLAHAQIYIASIFLRVICTTAGRFARCWW